MKLSQDEILTMLRLIGAEQYFNEKYMGDVAEEENKVLKNIDEKLRDALREIIETRERR